MKNSNIKHPNHVKWVKIFTIYLMNIQSHLDIQSKRASHAAKEYIKQCYYLNKGPNLWLIHVFQYENINRTIFNIFCNSKLNLTCSQSFNVKLITSTPVQLQQATNLQMLPVLINSALMESIFCTEAKDSDILSALFSGLSQLQ